MLFCMVGGRPPLADAWAVGGTTKAAWNASHGLGTRAIFIEIHPASLYSLEKTKRLSIRDFPLSHSMMMCRANARGK